MMAREKKKKTHTNISFSEVIDPEAITMRIKTGRRLWVTVLSKTYSWQQRWVPCIHSLSVWWICWSSPAPSHVHATCPWSRDCLSDIHWIQGVANPFWWLLGGRSHNQTIILSPLVKSSIFTYSTNMEDVVKTGEENFESPSTDPIHCNAEAWPSGSRAWYQNQRITTLPSICWTEHETYMAICSYFVIYMHWPTFHQHILFTFP